MAETPRRAAPARRRSRWAVTFAVVLALTVGVTFGLSLWLKQRRDGVVAGTVRPGQAMALSDVGARLELVSFEAREAWPQEGKTGRAIQTIPDATIVRIEARLTAERDGVVVRCGWRLRTKDGSRYESRDGRGVTGAPSQECPSAEHPLARGESVTQVLFYSVPLTRVDGMTTEFSTTGFSRGGTIVVGTPR